MLSNEKFVRILWMVAVPSAVSVGLVLGRFAYVADLRFRFSGLVWNLALAWIPMVLTWAIWRLGAARWAAGSVVFAGWLLFFPNTFYIITDMIHDHKFGTDGVYRWYDIFMTACFAVSGMLLGSFSLFVLHDLVRERRGRLAGWVFAVVVLAVSAYGTYLGRVLRLNSWDALLRPRGIIETISNASGSGAEVVLFTGTFFLFSALAYWAIVAATNLHGPAQRAA